MVITDPKAEILRKTGAFLLAQGYEVRVFDLIDPSASFCYNPFCYVQSDKDVLQLIADLIQNTTPPNAHENDPFWSKAETALLQALMLYLIHEAPADEQNFAMVMEMIAAAEVREDDADYQSPLDILFERLQTVPYFQAGSGQDGAFDSGQRWRSAGGIQSAADRTADYGRRTASGRTRRTQDCAVLLHP